MKLKLFITGLTLMFMLILAGCSNSEAVTGQAVVQLGESSIKNGESTTITVDGKNTGNLPATAYFKVLVEEASKVIVTYPGKLEFELQPEENTGKRIIQLQGFTDYTSTKYKIVVQLINKADNSTLDEKTEYLTVNK